MSDDAHDHVPDPFFDALDRADPGHRERMARLEQLHELWRDVPTEEVLHDLNIATQLVLFKLRQERLLLEAKIATAQGATHECSEWADDDRRCRVCGKSL